VNTLGAAESTGGSEKFASGPPARGENQGRNRRGRSGSRGKQTGDFVDHSGGDASTTETSTGRAGDTPNPGRTIHDDAGTGFADTAEVARHDMDDDARQADDDDESDVDEA